jgi:hypothetical protein
MIQLLGSQEGREAEAGRALRDIVLASWPWVATDARASMSIVAGVKCHAQKRRDMDLVLLATFADPVRFTPFLDISSGSGGVFRPKEAFIDSLCVVIEVKEQDAKGIRFVGAGRVDVRYFRGGSAVWSSASDQSEEQKYSLKNYFEHYRVPAPHIGNLIWLRNLLNKDLPQRPHNMLGGNSTWELFINVLFQLDRTHRPNVGWLLAARRAGAAGSFRAATDLLTRVLQPTELDRGRMDRICKAAVREDWLNVLGDRQLILRGHGGCGKTMLLLQLAWRLYETQNRRILVLTYNRALAADLRRMLTLLGVPDDVGTRHIQIQTVYSFFHAVLRALGLISGNEEDFLLRYEAVKDEALAMLNTGAVTPQDVAKLIAEQPLAFGWDHVFIDEGQDWPGNERDLLRHFFPRRPFVVADGIDQLVRGTECDWQAGLPAGASQTVFLPICLRMKAALGQFCNEVASALGLGTWNLEVHSEAPGGRIVIIEGDYFADRGFHDALVAEGAKAGNQPVDMLGCVPPALVARDADQSIVGCLPGESLRAWGYEVWDGTAAEARTGYPLSPSEFRVVSYDSSRGLEGWAVVLWGLDSFFEYKLSEWQARQPGGASPDADRRAGLHAARWLMIPLTRAMDTLVIQVGQRPSRIRTVLERVADRCEDFVDWRGA